MQYKKEEIMEKICIASRLQNLGFFVGSGFSKSLLIDSQLSSYSWAELLLEICKEYSITEELFKEGSTYPLVASRIIEIVQENNKCSFEEANRRVKISIAKIVNKIPNEEIILKYKAFFESVSPCWIVTTNYDNVLEQVIGPTAYPILPGQLFYNSKNTLPVYHIHGSVLDPQSIVITNEDYAKTLRPSDYRHTRLPILLKENTVLMIGYAIGDLNVISAIDYCENVYKGFNPTKNSIIQLVYTDNPKEYCYEKNKIIIYEIDSISSFFEELFDYISRYKSYVGKIINKIEKKQEEFINSTDDYVNKFDNNEDNYRNDTINFIYELDSNYWYIYSSFISLLQRVFNKNMEGAKYIYQFQFYDYYLTILLDLIEKIKVDMVPVLYINYLIERLIFIAPYIGETLGKSFAAYETWKKRMLNIPNEFIEKIKNYFETTRYSISLMRLLMINKNESDKENINE